MSLIFVLLQFDAYMPLLAQKVIPGRYSHQGIQITNVVLFIKPGSGIVAIVHIYISVTGEF